MGPLFELDEYVEIADVGETITRDGAVHGTSSDTVHDPERGQLGVVDLDAAAEVHVAVLPRRPASPPPSANDGRTPPACDDGESDPDPSHAVDSPSGQGRSAPSASITDPRGRTSPAPSG